MEYVENKMFIHIQRENNGTKAPLWSVGESHFIGQRKNRFFDFYDNLGSPYNQSDLESTRRALGHTSKVIRELIFEEVRKEFFPSHPSRQKGLWVIKLDDPGSLNYWKETLKGDKIFKVQLTGKIHTANQQYLIPTTENLNKIRQNAFHYWTGTSGARAEEQETLFEGFATVIEDITNITSS